MDCPFCAPEDGRVFHRGRLVIGLWSELPQAPGHAILVPRRHITDWFTTTKPEQQELFETLEITRELVQTAHKPLGYDISIDYQAEGHLQVQLIPRMAAPKLLSTGDKIDPFSRMLVPLLERARGVNIAVAFVQPSGLNILEPIFKSMLERKASLRLVTGDTLGVTDPDALARLLDLADSYPELAAIRIFESSGQSYHPKAYHIQDLDGSETAFVGSSNLTGSALKEGVEWNFRIVRNQAGLAEVSLAFEALFHHQKTQPLTHGWIHRYRQRRNPPTIFGGASIAAETTPLEERKTYIPHPVQEEALHALRATRDEGNRAGLVVLATGLGKTYLAAFDSESFPRVLFVAHREEILNQARTTFRRVRPNDELGFYTGSEKTDHAPVLFASVQTLSRTKHLNRFARDAFDYIIIDEFHHADAQTYRRLIEYFQPQFLLGLTATPDRADGGDLLALCMENLVYRCDLLEGVRRKLLAPFHYFGVPDTVDYQKVTWMGRRFDPNDLEAALVVKERAEHALQQYRHRAGQRTLVFCSSQRHSDFMDEFFRSRGLRSASIHSGPTSAPRTTSLDQLRDGELDLICSVDMFNEGLDLPAIDTVMMLRPTESPVLWLQQFGRGLRVSDDKQQLTVIDYIGNHRIFFSRPNLLLGKDNQDNVALTRLLDELRGHADLGLPEGCLIDFDLVAIELLESLLKRDPNDAFLAWYQGFKGLHGHRPSALEALHQGYNPNSVRQRNGSWLGFLSAQGEFDQATASAFLQAKDFLFELENTKPNKSHKMVVLQAMLNLQVLPGSVAMTTLASEVLSVNSRSAKLRAALPLSSENISSIQQLAVSWVDESPNYFRLEGDQFTCDVQPKSPELVTLIDELVAWRLAEYLLSTGEGLICRVEQKGVRPVIVLPIRKDPDPIPTGPTQVTINDTLYWVLFDRNDISVIQPVAGKSDNILPRILRGWFGREAGQNGTAHRVTFQQSGGKWTLSPTINPASTAGPIVGQSYAREQIPGLFGLDFSTGAWNKGYVTTPENLFLLVTLSKKGMNADHAYEDRFLEDGRFQWQSQNRTTRASKDGLRLKNHQQLGISVHLFVRSDKRAPFKYEGQLQFDNWTGDGPITINWRRRTDF